MRTGSPRSPLALGFFAVVGLSCGQLAPWWDAVPKGNGPGTGTGGTGTGGTSAPAPTPVTCSESVDATGRTCKTCVDASGMVVSTDCGSNVPGMMCANIDGGGGSTSCKPYDVWKQYGSDTCQQKNMQLTNLLTGPSCGGTSYQNVTYVCCATTPSGSAGTGGSPGGGSGGTGGPSGQMCTTNRLSSGTICRSADLWKEEAAATCTQQNLRLTSITPGPACDGGIVGVTFTCCAPTPSPPPPPKCTQTVDAGGQVCKTCVDAVTGMVISNDCAPGPDSGVCVTIDDGGPSSCKDEATWKKYGTDRCAQQSLPLTDLKLAVACAGGYSMVTYVCCGSGAP
jgi:hypothetical protein